MNTAIEIEQSSSIQTRARLLDKGLYYLVTPDKRETAYTTRPLHVQTITTEQKKYLGRFADENEQVTADLIDPGEKILEGTQVGATKDTLETARRAQAQWLEVAHGFLSTETGQALFRELMSERDQQISEFHEFVAERRPLRDGKQKDGSYVRHGYINRGTIIRIDEMLTEDDRLLACDPNLVPLGFAFYHGFASEYLELQKPEQATIATHDLYPNRLGKLVRSNGNNLSGIVTTLDYPNWPSHVYIAEKVRELTDSPFYVIPLETVNPENGKVDSNQVADMYKKLGLRGADSILEQGTIIPGVLVRYSRELKTTHPDTKVVNRPGFRVLESQVWNGLMTLPGFKSLYQGLTGGNIDHILHRAANIPTLIGRMTGDQSVQIAISIDQTAQINWMGIEEAYDQLYFLQRFIATTDSLGELAWFVKTFSTSGKKGVRLTNGGNFDKSEKNIVKSVRSMGVNNGAFLIQPKVHSAVELTQLDGKTVEERLKVDLFLSGEDLAIAGVDAMTTPIGQRSSHGGSQTKLNVVKV